MVDNGPFGFAKQLKYSAFMDEPKVSKDNDFNLVGAEFKCDSPASPAKNRPSQVMEGERAGSRLRQSIVGGLNLSVHIDNLINQRIPGLDETPV